MKQNPAQRAATRAKIAKLALFGDKTQWDIARETGLNQSTISRELKSIRQEWAQQARQDIEQVIARELKKIEALEEEAWIAYEKSQRDAISKTVTDGKATGGKKTASITTQSQNGDPRFLKILLDCQDRRAKVLGIDKKDPSIVINNSETIDASKLSDAALREIIEATRAEH